MISAISGKARSGKNQFAEYLIECLKERHQRDFKEVAFATQLKTMCKNHFKLTYDQLWGDDKEKPDIRYFHPDRQGIPPYCLGNREDGKGLEYIEERKFWTPREIMQELGGFYRRIDYNFWVTALDKYLKKEVIKDAIITDVRHVNECEYVKKNQGVLIKVIRENADKIHGMDHESETALDDRPEDYFDIEINNSGTLEDLYTAAEETSDAIIMIENMINKGRIV